ncbi:MAG: peptide chain release factor N(5)-glutamine methyltransferase [Candidatus Berkelbacteria bacterium]|nr:MAG: peptide chain release factor N(5)-glutamine methyltransferase [Candidatus Berkelbacteria bacterium]QQG51550.1 MAG: peptide chain release factor N(5)-glutamine methyltransferase [Candidatus Berkelbacteria bacterium]
MSTINALLGAAAQRLQEAGYTHGQREAETILGYLTDSDTTRLFTHGSEELPESVASRFTQAINDRLQGKPLAYIVGSQQFLGWQLKVDERALIPRPETEQLVEFLVKMIRERKFQGAKVLEVGTGSGAVAIALKKYFPSSIVTATDISPEALELAEDNARRLGAEIELCESDLLEKVPKNKYDVVVANLPYVPTERLAFVSEEILDWEPMVAIDAGDDGFKYISRLLGTIQPYLAKDAIIALEMWHTHADQIAESVDRNLPGGSVRIEPDLAGYDRFAFITT